MTAAIQAFGTIVAKAIGGAIGGAKGAAFAATAFQFGVLPALFAPKPPPVLGSAATITIGANQPCPMIIGEAYCGGARVAQVGYGTEDNVPNAHAWLVDIYSRGGPLNALVAVYTDFNAITFSGPDNAVGYYHNNLHFTYQMGATPEAGRLTEHWAGAPDWGAAYKLSGYAAGGWNARWPKDGKIFAAGFPQTGTVWQGVLDYDPRQDSTYPGGSGAHRWADPSDATAFAAAKATWDYGGGCPGRAALRYALGTWERAGSPDPFIQTFGMGLPIDSIVAEDFVELANVCDANGWKANGVIYEPGDRWANLKRICAAGGAEPVWKGGRLGLRISAPGVALDTIGFEDLAGEASALAMQSYRDRPNTLVSKTMEPGQKWTYAPTATIQVTGYVTADGGERREEVQWDLVTDPTQGAQLTAYMLVDGREQGAELTLKSEWRTAKAGQRFALSAALAASLALDTTDVKVVHRRFDPATMTATLTLVTDTAAKHTYALAQTATSPPALTILPPDEIDGAVNGDPGGIAAIIRGAGIVVSGNLLTATDAGSNASIAVANHEWDYPNGAANVARTGATITALSYSTTYYVYFDDATLSNATDPPTYFATTVQVDAVNSTANPFRHYLGSVTTPGSGGGSVGGGGDGGGHPGVVEP